MSDRPISDLMEHVLAPMLIKAQLAELQEGPTMGEELILQAAANAESWAQLQAEKETMFADDEHQRRAVLVCEGNCNPGLPRLDERVHEYRKLEMSLTRSYQPITDPALVNDLRKLLQTEHRQVGEGVWQCLICYKLRKF
jgi:hypothetical protein